MTVQNRIFFTYLYLDNTTGMTHLKIINIVYSISMKPKVNVKYNKCIGSGYTIP